ncbi:MAG: hypothetical protein JNL39_12465 [Opitutaceae bacterium]|nr:hypothetical protein [Opitutaceae bacterium]
MALFEGYSGDDLNRVLNFSRWTLGILALFTAAAGVFNQWVTERIADLQRAEKTKAHERLKASEEELAATKARTAEVAGQLERLTVPRRLTEVQRAILRKNLPTGPRGKVIVTFLSVERDAQKYADEIGEILKETGFDVVSSNYLWLQLAFEGLYINGREAGKIPSHAIHLQKCFSEAGLRVKGAYDQKMMNDLQAPEDAIAFVVSNR